MLSVYFAQKAFVVHEGRLLAVRRSATDSRHPLRWEVPGGRLEANEDLDAHLKREVFEETGIQINIGEVFYVWKWHIKPADVNSPATIVAVARICSSVTTELNDSNRVGGDNLDLMEWIPFPNLANYEWIPNMLPVLDSFVLKMKASNEKNLETEK